MRLREIRESQNKTQTEVAQYLGISRQGYNNYELENREPNHEMLLKLSNLFGVSVDYILGKDEKEIPQVIAAVGGGLSKYNDSNTDPILEAKDKLIRDIYAADLRPEQIEELRIIVRSFERI